MSDARLSECSARVISTRVMRVMHARLMRGEDKPRGAHTWKGRDIHSFRLRAVNYTPHCKQKHNTLLFNFRRIVTVSILLLIVHSKSVFHETPSFGSNSTGYGV